MIMVNIEMWPGGDSARKRPIGSMTIANIGGSSERGDYRVRLMKSPEYAKTAGVWKSGKVEGFRRHFGPFDLLLQALVACIAYRAETPLPSLAAIERAAEADCTGLALFDAAGGAA
jgi:hypothetical protein